MTQDRFSGVKTSANARSGRQILINVRGWASAMGFRGFRFIDLFAGIGGMRLGLERAGGRCVYSSEINKHAVETYKANFVGEVAGDITEVDARDIPDHDVLAAGFPCQPFSLAGISKRKSLNLPSGTNSPQGRMFDEIVRILRRKKPSALLLENVKHLKSYDKGRVFREMERKLEDLGYNVHNDVIDARSVVPQHRERVFIVGFDRDVGFEFPEIRNTEMRLGDILERNTDSKYRLTPGTWRALKRHRRENERRGTGFGYHIASTGSVSRTLSRRYYKDGAEILIQRGGADIPRRLTPRECARLMGFPEKFKIPVSDSQAYRQFGNSVVPPIVAAIGREMARHIGARHVLAARRREGITRRQSG
ncbi:MAG: DNA (cytosine-5-)-methyltransferase [Alphaproteobacteria bacterium]|nr:DNA (cytosine-5-)-methyltransferase [Alphaproteobacteria bacterium]